MTEYYHTPGLKCGILTNHFWGVLPQTTGLASDPTGGRGHPCLHLLLSEPTLSDPPNIFDTPPPMSQLIFEGEMRIVNAWNNLPVD